MIPPLCPPSLRVPRPLLLAGAAAAGLFLTPAAALALTFTPAVFDAANSPSRPASDPTGTKLAAHADQAAGRWARGIADAHTIAMTVRYDTAAPARGRLEILGATGGKVTNLRIRINPVIDWNFDSDPSTDAEFFPVQRFAEDENLLAAGYAFRGSPPGRLEISFSGTNFLGASKTDLLTVLVHHLGRALGFSDFFTAARTEIDGDGDVDLTPGWVAGATMAVKNNAAENPDDYSLAVEYSALNWQVTGIPGRRVLPSALDYLTVAECGGWTLVRLPRMEMLRAGTQSYGTGLNWPGGWQPLTGAAVSMQQAAASTVTVVSTTADSLQLGGSTLLTVDPSGSLTVNSLTIRHNGNAFQIPRLIVQPAAVLAADVFDVVGGIAEVRGTARADAVSVSAARVTGRAGRLEVSGTLSTDSLTNNGRFLSAGDTVAVPRLAGTATWDLDGTGEETEAVVEALSGDLTFQRISFTDAFDGTFSVGPAKVVSFAGSFTLGSAGRLNLASGSLRTGPDIPGTLTLQGMLNVTSGSTISMPVTFAPGSLTTLTSFLILREPPQISTGAGFAGDGELSFGPLAAAALRLPAGSWPGLRLSITNAGRLEPGDALSVPGQTVAVKSLTFAAGAGLTVDIGGTASGTFDAVAVSGAAELNGTLRADFSGFTPQPGQSWRILTAGQRTNEFTTLDITGADASGFEVLYDATGVTLRFKADPTIAEWLATKGVPVEQRGKRDDPDGDGVANCLEALLAMDPMTADRPVIIPNRVTINGVGYGAVQVRTNAQKFSDADLDVACSRDLTSWNVPVVPYAGFSPEPGVNVLSYRSSLPLTVSAQGYFRAACLDVIQLPGGGL